jgi:hypothetical protein
MLGQEEMEASAEHSRYVQLSQIYHSIQLNWLFASSNPEEVAKADDPSLKNQSEKPLAHYQSEN